MKILFCTDFTEASLYSLKKALPFIKTGFYLDIISVMDIGILDSASPTPSSYNANLEKYKKIKTQNLHKTQSELESKGLKTENLYYPVGNRADEIVNQINKVHYDLVILGSKSKPFFAKWLGSISRKVTEKSPVPVFIAKEIKEKSISKSKKVLFVVDGDENSYNAVKTASENFDIKNAKVEVLHVKKGIESFPAEMVSDKEWIESLLEKEEEYSQQIVAHASVIAEELGINVNQKTILEGTPVEEIVKYTDKSPKDLIIMGSHGREGIANLVLGSVSKGIIEHTHCPVMIIPTKKLKNK